LAVAGTGTSIVAAGSIRAMTPSGEFVRMFRARSSFHPESAQDRWPDDPFEVIFREILYQNVNLPG
jgi:hypothetical protein